MGSGYGIGKVSESLLAFFVETLGSKGLNLKSLTGPDSDFTTLASKTDGLVFYHLFSLVLPVALFL